MTTSELERRLAALLQRHAEDAMNNTHTEEQLERLLVDAERHARRRRLGWAAAGLAAAAAAAALIAWLPGSGPREAGPALPAQETQAEQVATAFVQAYGSFDRDQAASYLADDADLSVWTDAEGDDRWRLGNRWQEATGYKLLLDSCEEQGISSAGTEVGCTFDYHSLGSEELGRGPYSGDTFTFTIKDGMIVAAWQHLAFETNGFSDQMWEPFARWVSEAYPKDAAVMYANWPFTSLEALTPRSFKLWREHVKDYVEEQAGRNS